MQIQEDSSYYVTKLNWNCYGLMRAYAKENKKTNDWKPRSGGTEKNKFTDPDLNNEWNKMESNSSVMLFMSHFRFRDCQPYIVNANVLKFMEYEMLNLIKHLDQSQSWPPQLSTFHSWFSCRYLPSAWDLPTWRRKRSIRNISQKITPCELQSFADCFRMSFGRLRLWNK